MKEGPLCILGAESCHSFRLGGGVEYGKPPPAAHYEPVFEGPVPGGGTWMACTHVQQPSSKCPGNPPVPDKSLANALSIGSGVVGLAPVAEIVPVYGQLAATGLGVFGLITGLIAADPPDHHFEHVTHPPRIGALRVPVSRGVSRRQANAATRVFGAIAQAAASGEAFLAALQRLQGAATAVNPRWIYTQWSTTLKYGRQFTAACRLGARTIGSEREILIRSRLAKVTVPSSKLKRLLAAIRRHGLARQTVRQLSRWGFSAATIQAARRVTPSMPVASSESPLGAVLSPSFATNLTAFADGLDKYLGELSQGPLR